MCNKPIVNVLRESFIVLPYNIGNIESVVCVMAISTLKKAQKEKFDEFYTQYFDVESEMNAYLDFDPNVFRDKVVLLPCDDPEWSNFTRFFAQNFEFLGLKKLISTSYATESKKFKYPLQMSIFEMEDERYNPTISQTHGKIFTLTREKSHKVNINDLKWDYLEGDGDFRSDEIKTLRDEADIIVTNPPFSLFREFLDWILEADKKFIILGNENDASNKEMFPLIYEGKVWLGKNSGDMEFKVPKETEPREVRFRVDDNGQKWISHGNICWYTNIDLARRHTELQLMTMAENLRYNKALIKKLNEEYNTNEYPHLDNYDAIEVPLYKAIPSDYDGVMAVPVTFLKFHNPLQFRILGCTQRGCHDEVPDIKRYDDYWEVQPNGQRTGSNGSKTNENANIEKQDGKHNYFINEEGHVVQSLYGRIFIKHRR